MGRARDELAPRIRSFPFGRCLLFYLPIGDGIDVVRVLHGARDVDTVFSEGNAQGRHGRGRPGAGRPRRRGLLWQYRFLRMTNTLGIVP
jgi:hypothetical protein